MTAAKILPIYAILNVFDEIHEEVADGQGEITAEQQARLGDAYDSLGDQLQGLRDWYFSLKASQAAYKSEQQRLAAQVASCDQSMKWAKSYVDLILKRLGVEKYPLHRGKLWRQPNSSASISWPGDPETAPKAYQRWTCSLNGEKAQEDQRAGKLPKGFEVERGSHVRLS